MNDDLDRFFGYPEPTQVYTTIKMRKKMIALEPGTILEKEYKGNKIKVKVLKDGTFSFNGKAYADRGSLMKAVTKGKTAQFTTFFGLAKGEKKAKKNGKVEEVVNNDVPDDVRDIINFDIDALNTLIDSRIQNFFRK